LPLVYENQKIGEQQSLNVSAMEAGKYFLVLRFMDQVILEKLLVID